MYADATQKEVKHNKLDFASGTTAQAIISKFRNSMKYTDRMYAWTKKNTCNDLK